MLHTIDGAALARMMIHAAAALGTQKQHINDLNVFPVPDGDTGTNMCMTLNAAAAELKKAGPQTVGEAAAINASALLRGARGNSGVILSLLFRGFSKSLRDMETADGVALANAMSDGVAAAYKAVMKPAEGTILTVSRVTSKRAQEAAAEQNDAIYVLEKAIEECTVALAGTVNQNPVLKKAGVVDAGAKGYLIILQGMLDSLNGLPMPEAVDDGADTAAEFSGFSDAEITFTYCTEFICQREQKKDPDLLRRFLNGLGDSLVLVDDDDIIKVHVHTDHPGRVLEEALTYGCLLTVKIENMREQHTELVQAEQAAKTPPQSAPPEKDYGLVAVCAGDGLAALFGDLGCDGVISGGQTMNPSTEDILREIEKTPARTVFVLPNNKNIIMAAEQCCALASDKQVVVLPTRTVPEGIAALLVFDPDATVDDNVATMTAAFRKVFTGEITYAARDSDMDGLSIKQGDYMALAGGKLLGTEAELPAMLTRLAQTEPMQKAEFISIFYGENVSHDDAAAAEALFQAACPDAEINLLRGGQPVYYYTISAE